MVTDGRGDLCTGTALTRDLVLMLTSGGTIASWNLANGFVLQLDMSSGGKVLNQYTFNLYSQRIIEEEKNAAREAGEVEKRKAKSVNPTPKFSLKIVFSLVLRNWI